MGLGIQGAFGAMGAQQTLQQILAARRAEQMMAAQAQQVQFENQRQLAGDSRAERQLSNQEAATKAATARQAGLDQENRDQHAYTEANSLAEQIPPGQFLGQLDPAVGRLQTGGRGSLLQPQDARPAIETGPLLPGDTGAAKQQGFIKTASQKQIDTNADNERQAASAKALADREAATTTETNRHNRAMEGRQGPGATVVVQTVDEHGNPVTRIVPKTANTEFQRPASNQERQASASKHEALGSLQQLDQAIEEAKDLIGPGAGRISSIQQMVGNPNPKIAALGTKMLLAKMQVDHAATGTVRAGASPQILARWDNILGNNQDAASLKASVQAMREILGGGSGPAMGGGTVSMIAPDGRALNVPADKVAELEAAGAKRK